MAQPNGNNTNAGCDEHTKGQVTLSYDIWDVSEKDISWEWKKVGSGFVAKFRAKQTDGNVFRHTCGLIPSHLQARLGTPSMGRSRSGNSYLVTMSRPQAVSIQSYFDVPPPPLPWTPNGNTTDAGCDEDTPGKVILSYEIWDVESDKDISWEWKQVGSGFVAKFRAKQTDGNVLRHTCGLIPSHLQARLGTLSMGRSGDSYLVTMSRPQDFSIQSYFDAPPPPLPWTPNGNTTNAECNEHTPGRVTLSYEIWDVESDKDISWEWKQVGSDFVAKFRAKQTVGKKLKHTCGLIPDHLKARLGTPREGRSRGGGSYLVTMSRPQDVSIQSYFDTAPPREEEVKD